MVKPWLNHVKPLLLMINNQDFWWLTHVKPLCFHIFLWLNLYFSICLMVKHLFFPYVWWLNILFFHVQLRAKTKKTPSSVAWPVSSTHGRVHLAPFLGGGASLGQKPWENDEKMLTGWWFGTMEFWMTFHILGIISPTDFHIFQRGWNHQPGDLTWENDGNMVI